MNDRIAILRQAVTAITQSLAGMDIEVTQAGLDAYVQADATGKPVRVNLPYVPDNADPSLIDAIQGFLDHEVAHILFSDFTEIGKIRDQALHTFVNILEDARAEKLMAAKYRGCGSNLTNTSSFFLDNLIEPEVRKAVKKGATEEEMIGLLATPLLRAMSGQSRHQDYMKDKMKHVDGFYNKIKDLAPKIEKLSSTKEVVDMAKTIIKRIKEETPPEPEDDKGEDEDEKSTSIEMGKGGSKGKGESAPEDEKDDESEEDGEGESSGSAGGDDEGEDEEPKGDEEEGEGKGAESKPSDEQPVGDVSNVDGTAMLREIEKNKANNFDSSISRKMGEQAAMAAKGSQYLVYTQDSDRVETLQVGRGFRPQMVSDLTDKVDAMVGPMAKDLERAMRARSLATWENGLRRGKLNSSALARLRTGDDRVFRQRHENTTNDVAVSLVVDASGSMSGSKIHTAAASAYALSSVLDRLKITHEVICFTTGGQVDVSKMREQEKKYGVRYARYEALYMPIVKGYGERLQTETKKRFAWLPNGSFFANNVDGECVDVAYRRLQQRKEKGKIMIVLSDGMPSAGGGGADLSRHLKDTVKKIESSGTKVIGIGIQSTAVKSFYSKNIVVNNVEDLPKGVISELRTMLLAN